MKSNLDIFDPKAVDEEHEQMDQFVQFRVKFNTVTVEDQYGKLLSYRTALESEGSLSLNVAMEADSLLGGGEFVKLYFDGSIPKARKHVVAMEAMDGGIMALMAVGAGAVVAIIVKIIQYFKGTHGGKEQALDAMQKSARNLTLHGDAQIAASQALVSSQHQVAQEDYFKPYLTEHAMLVKPLTPLQLDHLSTGEYSRGMQGLFRTVAETHPVQLIGSSRQAFRDLLRTLKDVPGDDLVAELKQGYAKLMEKPQAAHRELMTKINELRDKEERLANGQVEFPHDINHALRCFTAALASRDLASYVEAREAMLPELERLRKEAEEVRAGFEQAKGVQHSDLSRMLTEHSKEVLRELHGLLAVMLKTDLEFQKYWKSLHVTAKYLHYVLGMARWKVYKDLQEKGTLRRELEADPALQQLDAAMSALDEFYKKSA